VFTQTVPTTTLPGVAFAGTVALIALSVQFTIPPVAPLKITLPCVVEKL